jgi:hypothetical protein
LQRAVDTTVAGLSPDQLLCRLPGKWCAAEILEHLYLTYTGTARGFTRALEQGTPLASPVTWKNRVQSFLVVNLGYLPTGRKSPPNVLPRGLAAEKVVAEFSSKIAEMDQIMSSCAARFGARTRVLDHPILGPFSINQWRKFHLVHGLHHVAQLRTLRDQMRAGKI